MTVRSVATIRRPPCPETSCPEAPATSLQRPLADYAALIGGDF
ncbi:hypothetical protein [Rhodoplanes roseus]|nr:hypothetical protein [Rhodoplanes roseus]